MGYEVGWDHDLQRDIGYGVPAVCEHPECEERIDRGMAHACGGGFPRDNEGCGLFFCGKHLFPNHCLRCTNEADTPFPPKPDLQEWIDHKMTDPSWAKWREANNVNAVFSEKSA